MIGFQTMFVFGTYTLKLARVGDHAVSTGQWPWAGQTTPRPDLTSRPYRRTVPCRAGPSHACGRGICIVQPRTSSPYSNSLNYPAFPSNLPVLYVVPPSELLRGYTDGRGETGRAETRGNPSSNNQPDNVIIIDSTEERIRDRDRAYE